ncbi:MAG: hypothetical protein ACI8VR_002123, partial [Candidatus Azotimanducaceae bacterium]
MLFIILSCLTLLLLIGFLAVLKWGAVSTGRPIAGVLFFCVIAMLVAQQSVVVFRLLESSDTMALMAASMLWAVLFVLLVTLVPTARMLLQRRRVAGDYENLLSNMAD